MRILMIQRAKQFSPNSVEKDRAILEAVANRLQGHIVTVVPEENALGVNFSPQCIFSMARLPETLTWLRTRSVQRIINSPDGVENCARSRLEVLMESIGTPRPPKDGSDGYWLKRGDAAAQSEDDVQYAADRHDLEQKILSMQHRGISNYTVSAHVVGDVVKFYGVRGSGFFRFYYPTDDGGSKFGDERHNGVAHHYHFNVADVQAKAEELAAAVGVEVYGGDCVVRADGTYCFIDFNDWPSFSRCREEAADVIAQLAMKE